MPSTTTAAGAAIEAATVEIRTLTVNGRQMTPGFLRQLPELRVINSDGTIDGTPWGFVSYHPDKCEAAKEHLHIVWQCGTALNRAFVPSPEGALFEHHAATQYAMSLIAEGATQHDGGSLRVIRSERGGLANARFNAWGMSFWAHIPHKFLLAWESGRSDVDALQAEAYENFGTSLRPSREVKEELPVDAYKASWRALRSLPQLFIGR
ncbi:hypothetical protein ABZZ36_18265 [Actinacidiphila glaucinigra]|uniref:hypothetical protein n=1 Tax=Actinacidiphila glaucinigra TaxID=235986 RepID=UPI0033A09F72